MSQQPQQMYLSPPDVGEDERRALLAALDSGWVAPVGPDLNAFERDVAAFVGVEHAVALASGTAGLHLALLTLGVGPGDEVLVSTLTFVASANAVAYTGATPVFVDADPATWQMDPALLEEALQARAAAGRLPRAVVVVDLYGQCADYDRILAACAAYDVPVIEDAAEALGATYRGRPAGSFGAAGVFSFNGNKIITTSGGGMVVGHDEGRIERIRFLSTQARDPAVHYEHSMMGFNYRMSNLLAALGRAQLAGLPPKIERRRAHFAAYRQAFADLPGVSPMPLADYGEATCWLTCVLVDEAESRGARDAVIERLQVERIEARPVWKPMHAQPLYASAEVIGGAVADRLFAQGLCLPSGSNLAEADRDRVIACVREVLG